MMAADGSGSIDARGEDLNGAAAAREQAVAKVPSDERWLIALDIDGTLMHEDGSIADVVIDQVRRVQALGHETMLATGRSVATMLPVLERLQLAPEYAVCSNGAITLRRDSKAPTGYRHDHVETFDPTSVLTTIRSKLTQARFAVEDETGFFRYTDEFPDSSIGLGGERVDFEELLQGRATRVVVISPNHDMQEFLDVVENMGLHRVSYAVGWTAWLDIAPDGVNKASALERVRGKLGIPRNRVLAVGDGRNDIDMLEWAAAEGRGVAMAHAPQDVLAIAGEVTGSVMEDGVAQLLAGF